MYRQQYATQTVSKSAVNTKKYFRKIKKIHTHVSKVNPGHEYQTK